MLSTKTATKLAKILVYVLILVTSVFVLSNKVPNAKFISESLESLENDKETVMAFSGATLGVSVAITFLPDDYATPLANTLADMSKYCVFLLVAIFLEKLIVTEGTKVALLYVIPAACLFLIAGQVINKDFLKNLGNKVLVLGLAVILVIPCSTHFIEAVGGDYLAYVNETIDEANSGSEKVNEVSNTNSEDKDIFEQLSGAFKTAIDSITDLVTYFSNVIKKCINSIAIMIVTTVVMPLLTLVFFRWLLKELFSISRPKAPVYVNVTQPDTDADKEGSKQNCAGDGEGHL